MTKPVPATVVKSVAASVAKVVAKPVAKPVVAAPRPTFGATVITPRNLKSDLLA